MKLRLIFKIEDVKVNPKLSSYAPHEKPLWVKFELNYTTKVAVCQLENIGFLRLFFDSMRLGKRTYRTWGKTRLKYMGWVGKVSRKRISEKLSA